MSYTEKKPSALKAAVKGVVGAGIATKVLGGLLVVAPVGFVAAGAYYAHRKAEAAGSPKQKTKVWASFAAVGVAAGVAMGAAGILLPASAAAFATTAALPLIGNRLAARRKERESTEKLAVDPNAPANRKPYTSPWS